MAPAVLVVDDEDLLAGALVRALRKAGLEAESVRDAETALARLDERAFRALLLDLTLPGMGGLEALAIVKERRPECEVVVVTGQGTVDAAVEAMKRGAFEFLQKPFESLDHVMLVVRRALERADLRAQNAELLSRLKPSGLIGVSPAMRAVAALVPDLARSDAAVLIEGESGTGKEVFAQAVHAAGPRAARAFVAVNCGAIPEATLESELFGHEKGAFTGAVAATRGLFRAAEGGTLFLDEVAELPPAMQVKLLRALQEREVRAVGATQSVRVDVRVIAATNRDARARLREDLYYRLAVVPVRLPPLRERREDVAPLVRHFVSRLNAHEPAPKFEEIDPAALDLLAAWSWPGNVRELENVIERAFALGKPGRLTVKHLPAEIAGTPRPGDVPRADLDRLPLSFDAYERAACERALAEAGGDAEAAAKLLGVPRSTFYRRLQRYRLTRRVR